MKKDIIKEAVQYYKENNIALPKKINELTKKDSERLQLFLDKVKSLVHPFKFKDIKKYILMSVVDPYNTANSIMKNVIRDYNLKISGFNESTVSRLDNYLKESIDKTILPKDQNGK